MYNVMLVDDVEEIFCSGLKGCVHWEDFGFNIVCIAKNGEQALSLFREYLPEVVFIDIVMPRMNGIELANEIITEAPDTKIVFLSKYNDFDYLKKALILGAYGYLLKVTLSGDDLKIFILALKEKLDSQKSARLQSLQREQTVNENLNLVRGNFYLQVITNQEIIIEPVFDEQKSILQLKLDYHAISILLAVQDIGEVSLQGLARKVSEIISTEYENVEVVEWSQQKLIVLFNNPDNKSLNPLLQRLYAQNYHELRPIFAVSAQPVDFSRVNIALQHTHTALDAAFYEPRGVLQQHSEDLFGNSEFRFSEKMQYRFETALESGDRKTIERFFTEIRALFALNRPAPAAVRRAFLGIFMCIEQYIPDFDHIFRIVDSAATLEALTTYAINSCIGIQKCGDVFIGCRAEIVQAIRYINANIFRNITLIEVASEVHMSPKYFCTIFKSETGKNFKQFLSDKKIEVAKRLLTCKGAKISVVAKKMGFINEEYFSVFFKKHTGMSPSDYIKKTMQ